ncbi:nucleoside monophosphate kinase, partial [Gammaproteobacteria bacterium]|nr:nucleoside monophosphate kinase [Gammaproteobacteria bacterium]
DVTQEPLSIREDDQPDIVKARLADYHKLTKPIIDWAEHNDDIVKNIIDLDASEHFDDVWREFIIKITDLES